MIEMIAATGSAFVGGVYGAFTTMVMPALRRRPAAEATATMRTINSVAERGIFVGVFCVTAGAGIALGISALTKLDTDAGARSVAAAALTLGSTAITVLGNVPLNRRLDREGPAFWATYDRSWTRLNTVRALAALAAVTLLTGA